MKNNKEIIKTFSKVTAFITLLLMIGCTIEIKPIDKTEKPIDKTEKPIKLSQIKLDFRNVNNQFKIDEKKLETPPIIENVKIYSTLSLLITAKQDINGLMYAHVYNKDNIRICSMGGGSYCSDDKFYIGFKDREYFCEDHGCESVPNNWQEGKQYRGFILVPNRTRKIEFIFEEK